MDNVVVILNIWTKERVSGSIHYVLNPNPLSLYANGKHIIKPKKQKASLDNFTPGIPRDWECPSQSPARIQTSDLGPADGSLLMSPDTPDVPDVSL